MEFDQNNSYFKQVQLLVSTLPYLKPYHCFGLKGGTAINIFLRNLPRLSVDIDLVYLPITERLEANIEIQKNLSLIAKDIEKSKMAKVIIKDNDQKLIIQNTEAQIKVEVSMMRGHLLPTQIVSVCKKIEESIGFAEVLLLDDREIYAGKLCATLDRQHPRDLFDVNQLLLDKIIDETLIDIFLIYLMSGNRPIVEMLAPNFKDISETYQKHFKGMSLKQVSLSELETTRESLLNKIYQCMHDNHKKLLLDFKTGEINWADCPFPKAQFLPAIKWKQINLNKMSKEKRAQAIQKLESVLTKI